MESRYVNQVRPFRKQHGKQCARLLQERVRSPAGTSAPKSGLGLSGCWRSRWKTRSLDPVEMAAVLAAARGAFPGRRIVLAFQPHRYTRTRDCFEDFVKVMGTADAVLLTGDATCFTAGADLKDTAGWANEALSLVERREIAGVGWRLDCAHASGVPSPQARTSRPATAARQSAPLGRRDGSALRGFGVCMPGRAGRAGWKGGKSSLSAGTAIIRAPFRRSP